MSGSLRGTAAPHEAMWTRGMQQLEEAVAPVLAACVQQTHEQLAAAMGACMGCSLDALVGELLSPSSFGGERRTLATALLQPGRGLRVPAAGAFDDLWQATGGPAALWRLLSTAASQPGLSPAVAALQRCSLWQPQQQLPLAASAKTPASAQRHASSLAPVRRARPDLHVQGTVARIPGDFLSCVAVHCTVPGFMVTASSAGVHRVDAGPVLAQLQRRSKGAQGAAAAPGALQRYQALLASPLSARAGTVAVEDACLVAPLDGALGAQGEQRLQSALATPWGSARAYAPGMSVVPVGAGNERLQHDALRSTVARLRASPARGGISSQAAVTCASMHPTLPYFVTGGVAQQVILWEHHDKAGICRYGSGAGDGGAAAPVSQHRVTALQWSVCGERIASTSDDGVLQIWDASAPSQPIFKRTTGLHSTAAVASLGSGLVAVAGSAAKRGSGGSAAAQAAAPDASNLLVVDVRAPPASSTVFSVDVAGGGVTALATHSLSGHLLAGGAGGGIAAVDLRSVSATLRSSPEHSHNGGVSALCVAPDGCGVLSGGADGVVRLWSRRLGQPLSAAAAFSPSTFFNHKLRSSMFSTVGVTGLAVCPGHVLASGADGRVLALGVGVDAGNTTGV